MKHQEDSIALLACFLHPLQSLTGRAAVALGMAIDSASMEEAKKPYQLPQAASWPDHHSTSTESLERNPAWETMVRWCTRPLPHLPNASTGEEGTQTQEQSNGLDFQDDPPTNKVKTLAPVSATHSTIAPAYRVRFLPLPVHPTGAPALAQGPFSPQEKIAQSLEKAMPSALNAKDSTGHTLDLENRLQATASAEKVSNTFHVNVAMTSNQPMGMPEHERLREALADILAQEARRHGIEV